MFAGSRRTNGSSVRQHWNRNDTFGGHGSWRSTSRTSSGNFRGSQSCRNQSTRGVQSKYSVDGISISLDLGADWGQTGNRSQYCALLRSFQARYGINGTQSPKHGGWKDWWNARTIQVQYFANYNFKKLFFLFIFYLFYLLYYYYLYLFIFIYFLFIFIYFYLFFI